MNISYNWLKKYIAADLSAEAMATILTDIGLEVESFEKIETVRGVGYRLAEPSAGDGAEGDDTAATASEE